MSAPDSRINAEVLRVRARAITQVRVVNRSVLFENVQPAELALWSSHYIGAALSSFLVPTLPDDLDEVPEDWAPYVAWFEALDDSHQLLTFNYDCVPTLLQERQQRRSRSSPVIHHLHGALPAPEVVAERIRAGAPLEGLGLPGRAKKDLVVGPLADAWDAAGDALRSADQIIIVGYSIPRTDAHTRMWLQRIIAHRAATTVHLVLGTGNPDVERLERALRFSNLTHVKDTKLYTEELLTKSIATGAFVMV